MISAGSVFAMENISVTRGANTILEGIDWTVNRGEHWVVIGGNGSGKTSLLKVLMGYLTPSSGTVRVRGRASAVSSPGKDWDHWRKRIGFVSTSIAEMIEPDETAAEVVMAGRHAMVNYWQRDAHELTADRAAAEAALKKAHCLHLAAQPWCLLSQGERQRILISRALMAPRLEVLILDEPCAGLDPVAREQFLRFVQDLTGKGSFKSLILVTHHVEEIVPNISHALVLREGRAVSSGPKRKALNSRSISEAFGGDLRLRSRMGQYRLYP